MLEITRQADYAIRASIEVALVEEGERISTATVAERQGIPRPFLTKIVAQLVTRGILESTRGANGGINLARPAEEISLLEVIEAIDGPLALNRCVINEDACEWSDSCVVCDVFEEAHNELVDVFGNRSLAQLAELTKEAQKAS